MTKMLGIGWDVGGWMGSKQGIAACQFNTFTNEFQWIGQPMNVKIVDFSQWNPEIILQQLDSNRSLEEYDIVVIGVDASLGFPIEYRKLVNQERISAKKPEKEIYNPFAYRETERHVYEKFRKKPLSAPFDKLGNNATLAITFSLNWNEEGFMIHPQQKSKADERMIIEVYPALIKKEPSRINEKVLDLVPKNVPINSDAYDASICSILALLYKGNGRIIENIFLQDPCINLEAVKEEGWIYYPIINQ